MKKAVAKNKELNRIKKIIVPILKRNGAVHAGIFGSAARGRMKKSSDIDILVDIKKKMSLFDFVGIKLELEDKLKREVDLVEYGTIKPRIKQKILEEEVKIL